MPIDQEVIDGVRSVGKYDATVGSRSDAVRLVAAALPHAVELPEATADLAYAPPPPGCKVWWQIQPPEPRVGNDLPHVKYADWTAGKKGRGGSWGHVYFPPT